MKTLCNTVVAKDYIINYVTDTQQCLTLAATDHHVEKMFNVLEAKILPQNCEDSVLLLWLLRIT